MPKKIAVLYHKNCPDGFGAAWAAWKKFGQKADYFAVEPHELPAKPIEDKDVYVLDNSYDGKDLEQLVSKNRSVMVIDHHSSSREAVRKAPQYSFDLNHSGAVLTWQYFHPKKTTPWLLRYVEDVDLWKWKLPFTPEISTYINAHQFDFKKWDRIANELEKKDGRKNYRFAGKIILQYLDQIIDELVNKADLVNFRGYKILAVNSSTKKLTSEIGNRLCKIRPPLGIVWYEQGGYFKVSLRSNGKVDVSKIAKKFGGGGHRAAAAFKAPIKKGLPWKITKK